MSSLIAQSVKNLPAMQEGKICWRRGSLPTPVFLVFPCDSADKESTCNVEDLGLIPGPERSPGGGKGYPLQYSGLEHSMGFTVHGVIKSQTQLSDFHFHVPHYIFCFKPIILLIASRLFFGDFGLFFVFCFFFLILGIVVYFWSWIYILYFSLLRKEKIWKYFKYFHIVKHIFLYFTEFNYNNYIKIFVC